RRLSMSPMQSALSVEEILEALPDAVLMVEDGRIVFVNDAVQALLDAEPGSLLGRALDELPFLKELRRLMSHLEAHLPGTVCSCVTRMELKTASAGEPVIVGCRARVLGGEKAGIRGPIILMLREVMDFTRAENLIASLAGLARSNVALSGMPEVIEAARPAFESLGWWAGLLKVSESGATLVQLMAPEIPDHPLVEFAKEVIGMGVLPWSWFPIVRRVYDSGEPLFLTGALGAIAGTSGFGPTFAKTLRQGGFSRAIWVPVRPGGVTTHILLVVGSDLTEHDLGAMQLFAALLAAGVRLEDLQKELLRREKLAAVGEMAGVLAHEVRNPLAVIFNAVSGLRRTLGPEADRDGLLAIIHEEADRLKRVVRDLLDFARPSSPELRPMRVHGLVEEVAAQAASGERAGRVRMEVALGDDLPMVRSDPHLLKRALANVMDNALQAVPDKGTIRVFAHPEGERWLRLCVENDGEPLSEEMRTKAFLPFYTTRATGTGLGLSVVKRTIDDLGARVALEPAEDGARVAIWLPVDEDGRSEPEERD
ncbi:MAG: ATP-binding protein, partial [Myxococcota bacterium]